jgi:hypothetical protein
MCADRRTPPSFVSVVTCAARGVLHETASIHNVTARGITREIDIIRRP